MHAGGLAGLCLLTEDFQTASRMVWFKHTHNNAPLTNANTKQNAVRHFRPVRSTTAPFRKIEESPPHQWQSLFNQVVVRFN
jgi:hypothetical protein